MNVPCYSARFIQPFAEVLSKNERYPIEFIDELRAIDPSTRISAAIANHAITQQVNQTGDPDLGLKAGRLMPVGGAGALSYAMRSASTIRQAFEVAGRFAGLFSDLLDIRLEIDQGRATLLIDTGTPAVRPIPDFAMSALYTNHLRAPLGDSALVECWFAHPRPPMTGEYERTFDRATLRFDAPSYGFAFDSDHLDAPLPCADLAVHAVLCEHAGLVLAQLSGRGTLAGSVREVTMKKLRQGTPSIFSVAGEFQMSPRSLCRKLEREGTTFSALLDDVRRELAERYVGRHETAFADIAFELRFSHVEGFYRAFKRWTGQTPLKYRRARGLVVDARSVGALPLARVSAGAVPAAYEHFKGQGERRV